MHVTVDLSEQVSKMIADARREAGKYRVQRNEARAELAQLKAELEALRAESK